MSLPEPTHNLLEEEKKKTIKAIQKKLASFAKAIKNATSQLQRSKEFEEVQHLAELVKSHFSRLKRGMDAITVEDWKNDNSEVTIALDPMASPQEIMQDMFRKSQKLKRAVTPLEALLKKLDQEHRAWQEALHQVEKIAELDALKALQREFQLFHEASAAPAKAKALAYHLFYSDSGLEIYVGKNAGSNEIVTFQVAHGNDIWLHAHAMSGAHVTIRKKRGQDVDPEALQDALNLALYYSKARQDTGSHEVLVTEKKYVSRLPRTAKGKVVVSKHKTFTVVLDKARIEKIKHRKSAAPKENK